ncbi:MAG: hypothetical protein Q9224_002170 [Gallowayella concinna]
MPMYNITLKDGASPDQLSKFGLCAQELQNLLANHGNRAKDDAKNQGGEIKHEFTLIKGFTVEFPADRVTTLETNEHIHVEQDGQVKTQ